MEKDLLPRDFKEFLNLLNSHEVEYLLIGGYAVGYHGFPRTTGGMDVWVARSVENERRLRAVLREFGFDPAEIPEGAFTEDHKIVRMGIPPLRIEILTSISGVSFQDAHARRVHWIVDGVKVPIIGHDDLIANKKASGRHKDLHDVENLP